MCALEARRLARNNRESMGEARFSTTLQFFFPLFIRTTAIEGINTTRPKFYTSINENELSQCQADKAFFSISLPLAGSMDNKNPYFDSRIKTLLGHNFRFLLCQRQIVSSQLTMWWANLSPLGQVPQLLCYAKFGCLVILTSSRSCFYSPPLFRWIFSLPQWRLQSI